MRSHVTEGAHGQIAAQKAGLSGLECRLTGAKRWSMVSGEAQSSASRGEKEAK